jgi:ProP effector
MSDPIQEPTVPTPPEGEPAVAPAVAPEVPAVPEASAEAAQTVTEAAPETPAAAPTEAPAEAAAPAQRELTPAATAALLVQHFPALFTPGQAKPIKLRIQADIQLRLPGVFTKKSLSLFLHRHTTSTPYLKALVASPQRFDLDGNPAGEVAVEHREAATLEVERRRAIVMAKRQAERQAQRPPRAAVQGAPEGAAAAAGQPGAEPRPPRTDRPPRPERPPRADRPPQARQERHERPPRPDRPNRPPRPEGPPRQQPPRPPREAAPAPQVDPAIAALSAEEQAGRRERALLLRAWETTTLTRSNFCVLKRIKEAELEAQLAQARQERPANVGVKPPR